MIDVEVSDGVVEAVDLAKHEEAIQVDGWAPASAGPPLDRRVDATIAGSTRGLTFRDAAVSIESPATDQWRVFDGRTGPFVLEEGVHVLQIVLTIGVYVAVTDRCQLARDDGTGEFQLRFDEPSTVAIGFRSHVDQPRDTITVPRTLTGAVEAIRHQSAAIETPTPDKSYPTKRTHPASIAFGRSVDIPASVRRATDHADITVHVPRALDQLLVVAPLVYYLQADLSLTDGSTGHIDTPALAEPLPLAGSPSLERQVRDVLRRVFFLDCLVRNAGPYGVDLQELELVEAIDLEPAAVYDRSGGERLAAYLQTDFASIADRLPTWHLSCVVEPSMASVRALPYLLDRLSLLQLPAPVAVDNRTIVSESIRRSYATEVRRWGATPAYDIVRNETRLGDRQGWLLDGTPLDAFRTTVTAFENRFRFHQRSDGPREVVVVINDQSMIDERAGVEQIYESRSDELAIDVTVEEAVTRTELARLLRTPIDFLHFIGHCDRSGLSCADGSLAVEELVGTQVQTFFLNACGSFDQGLALVEGGSVSGAVTLHDVLNPEATRVGLSFARLVMHGFTVSHALALASRQSLTNKFYAVVGDGTHRLTQGEDSFPADVTAERTVDDQVIVEFDFPPMSIPGGLAKPILPTASEYVLRGCPFRTVLTERQFVDFLTNVNIPVIYMDEFHWSTELAVKLAHERPVAMRSDAVR